MFQWQMIVYNLFMTFKISIKLNKCSADDANNYLKMTIYMSNFDQIHACAGYDSIVQCHKLYFIDGFQRH